MAYPSAPPPYGPHEKASTRQDPATVLRELIPIVLHETATQVELFPARLAGMLRNVPQEEGLTGASRLLHRNEVGFRRLLLTSLRDGLLREAEHLLRAPASAALAPPLDLSLNTFEAMESQVLIDALAQTLTVAHVGRLRRIETGISCLLGRATASHPFQPAIFLHAFVDAWRHLDTTGAPFHRLMRRMTPDLFLDLGPILDRIGQALPDQTLPETTEDANGFSGRLLRWLSSGDPVFHIARTRQLLRDMFDGYFHNQPCEGPVRAALMQLQSPLLNIALDDVRFFIHDDHPARRLLARVGQLAASLKDNKDANDPLCRALDSLGPRLLQESMPAVVHLCDDMACELAELMAAEERKAIARLALSIREARRQERIACAKKQAEQDVARRLESGEAESFVSLFLETQWTRVLGLAYAMQETRPDAVHNALETMDSLIRSIRPGLNPRERKDLIERLPALLTSLTGWLNLLKWEGPERDAFFTRLAAHHAMLARSSCELTARDQLQINIDVLQRASERRLNTQILEQQEAADDFDHLTDQAEAGIWVWFAHAGGSTRYCKLHWVSPLRMRYVFSDGKGEKGFTLSFDEFARALRHGQARLSMPDTAFDRALFHALHDLAFL